MVKGEEMFFALFVCHDVSNRFEMALHSEDGIFLLFIIMRFIAFGGIRRSSGIRSANYRPDCIAQ